MPFVAYMTTFVQKRYIKAGLLLPVGQILPSLYTAGQTTAGIREQGSFDSAGHFMHFAGWTGNLIYKSSAGKKVIVAMNTGVNNVNQKNMVQDTAISAVTPYIPAGSKKAEPGAGITVTWNSFFMYYSLTVLQHLWNNNQKRIKIFKFSVLAKQLQSIAIERRGEFFHPSYF